MVTISLCMIVKNEEKVLPRCLNSVRELVDEIIIIDTGSTDNTKEIAKEFTENVFNFNWINDFSAARNYSFSKAAMNYILWLDADDIILPEDQIKFKHLKQNLNPSVDVVMMKYNVNFDENDNITFSYFRERLLKRINSYCWKEPVHEFIELWGNINNSEICITHKKEKGSDPGRNLAIYENSISNCHDLSLRGMYYYARELLSNGKYNSAIEYFNKFLDNEDGWVEDKIWACYNLSLCYNNINDKKNVLQSLLKSFEYSIPRAEVCCELGYYYLSQKDYNKAIFWYKLATNLEKPIDNWCFVMHDCWDYIPNIQLCVCYDKLGNINEAIKYNDIAGKYKPYSTYVEYNKNYFNRVSDMPSDFRELMPHLLKRTVIESPTTILDFCKYPCGSALTVEEELINYSSNLIIDRIESDANKAYSLCKKPYRNIYSFDIINNLDTLPNYEVILLSDILEYYTKDKGFYLIEKLLEHTDKKLILIVPKTFKNTFKSNWSYIDFYKYNFSCNTIKVEESEFFIFSFYPVFKKINNIDTLYKNFKSSNSLPLDNKKLNIAYVLPHKWVTGGLKILIKQMKFLKDRGHSITGILQGDFTGSIFPDTNKIEIDKEIIISYNDKLDNYLKNYDVVVTGFINDWIKIEDKKLPVVLFEQGYETLFGDSKNLDPLAEKNHKLYFDSVYSSKQSLIISVSYIISDMLKYRFGRISDVTPNGIDTSVYYPIIKPENNIKKILLIGSPYLSFKGFDLALNVLQRLTDLGHKIEVTWICQKMPYWQIPININFIVNPQDDLLGKTIRENDILLSTSWYESFALPPLEAMASGTVVVATDNGGIKTYGINEYNCLLTTPGDEDSLLMALTSLILNKNKCDKLISNGLKTASEFNIDNMINLWEKTLYNVSNFYKLKK